MFTFLKPRTAELRAHFASLALYSAMILWVLIGLYLQYLPVYSLRLAGFIVMFFLTYALLLTPTIRTYLHSASRQVCRYFTLSPSWQERGLLGLGILSIAGILVHYIAIGSLPFVNIWMTNDYYEIVLTRQYITEDTPMWANYLRGWNTRAILPFLMVCFFLQRRRELLLLFMLVSSFYAVSLIQKSFIVVVFTPLLIAALWKRSWLALFACTAIIAGSIGFLVVTTNPTLRPQFIQEYTEDVMKTRNDAFENAEFKIQSLDKDKVISETDLKSIGLSKREYTVLKRREKLMKHADTLTRVRTIETVERGLDEQILDIGRWLGSRVFLTPGFVTGQWFTAVPKDIPFGYGCGYAFLRDILNCKKTIFYELETYKFYHSDMASNGVKGALNAPSFMLEYANFGVQGLIVSGVIIALILFAVTTCFSNSISLFMIFNFAHLNFMREAPLTTNLASGGWALTILLFVCFRPTLIAAWKSYSRAAHA